MNLKIWVLFAMVVMLSSFAFAAEAAAGEVGAAAGEGPAAEGAPAEGGHAAAEDEGGAEGGHGVSLGYGAQLIVMGVVASIIVLALVYFLLTKLRR
jgi:hypothetical protein